MGRLNFSESVKNVIKKRAGYRCSFPGCNKLLVGPGANSDAVIELGECAHIYGASPDGPRFTPDLSEQSVTSVDNGIFLCRKHHKIIDKKANEEKYPPSTLFLYKANHEHEISNEIGSLHYPLLWIKSITILKSPVLKEGKTYHFSKANILYGQNSAGKSVILEYIHAFLSGVCRKRMSRGKISLEVEFANFIYPKIVCDILDGDVRYKINGIQLQACPFSIESIIISDDFYDDKSRKKNDSFDEISFISGFTRKELRTIIDNYKNKNPLFADKVWYKTVRTRPYCIDNLMVRRKDCRKYEWDYRQFSGREQNYVVLDLLGSYLSEQSKFRNIILIIDWSRLHIFDKKTIQKVLNNLQASSDFFQIIVASHTNWESHLDLPGWNISNHLTREECIDIKR